MMRIPLAIKIFIAAALVAGLDCSTAPPVAGGGTVVGNPGAVARVTISAVDSAAFGLGRRAADSARIVVAHDSGTYTFTITTALLRVSGISFSFDEGENPDSILAGRTDGLYAEDSGASLAGPFIFDALADSVGSGPLSSLRLPAARYEGFRFIIGQDQNPALDSPCDIELGGTYVTDSSDHNPKPFSFKLCYSTSFQMRYKLAASVAIGEQDSVCFTVRMNAESWLADIPFASLIGSDIVPGADSALIIDQTQLPQPHSVLQTIRQSLMNPLRGTLILEKL